MSFFIGKNVNPKVHMETQKVQSSQSNPDKNNMVGHENRHVGQWDRIKYKKYDHRSIAIFLSTKFQEHTLEKRQLLQHMVLGKLDIHM
jgi:hypothetical protein